MPGIAPPVIAKHEADLPAGAPGTASAQTVWLMRQRVMLPDPVEGYVDRASLVARCDPVRRRITALSAPAGFGKTTLLAETCRRVRQRDELAAWLCLEDGDDASTLLSHIFLAFMDAGLSIPENSVGDGKGEIGYRMAVLAQSIQRHGAPCVLALDEVERLRASDSLSLLDQLIRYGPSNLHIALAYREHPHQLEIATAVLEGRGTVVTVEELRFSKPDIARFFDTRLSRDELAELHWETQGWPIALRVLRNVAGRADSSAVANELAANWIETRLVGGLAAEERRFVEEVGLFQWVDEDLLDRVVGRGSMRRLRAMPALAGLLHSRADSSALGIHPLLHSYCVAKVSRQSPERFRELHSQVAGVLKERGDVIGAMRHAQEAGMPELAADILEDAGGIRFWLHDGMRLARDANRLLTEGILQQYPRLLLARCALLAIVGELDTADRLYRAAFPGADAPLRDRPGGSDLALQVDNQIYLGLRALFGCWSVANPELRQVVDTSRKLSTRADVDQRARAALKYGIAIFEHQCGNFDAALSWTRELGDDDGRYLWMYSGFVFGATAFAKGHSRDAAKAYKNTRGAARRDFLHDAGPSFAGDVLIAELDLEQNKKALLPSRLAQLEQLAKRGAWLDVYVAAADSVAEAALRQTGPEAALDGLEEGLEFASRTGRSALRRCLAALYAEMLVLAGRLGPAAALWRSEALPEGVADCVNRDNLGWREMECVCRGRLQLLLARGEFAHAAELAAAFAATTQRAGLARSLTWALALSSAIDNAAGNTAAAQAHLIAYLRLHVRTDYARALIRQRESALPLLKTLDEEQLASGLRPGRAQLLRDMEIAAAAPLPHPGENDPATGLTPRELDILGRLSRASDREIAKALKLTTNGVRYHVNNIFRKLGVRNRQAAAQRARQLGIAG